MAGWPTLFVAGAAALGLALGCASTSSGPTAQDASRQSETEYDFARDLWLRRGDPRGALEHALKAAELDDRNPEVMHLVALLYLDFCSRNAAECRLPNAERAARRAIEVKPDFREAKNTLAVVLIHERRPAEAVKILVPLTEDILYQTPEDAWGNLGWAYLELGKLDESIDASRRSIAAQPQFCVGNYRLGIAYERHGEAALAEAAFTRALETDAPGCSGLQDAWFGRARVRLHGPNPPTALPDLERCVALSKSTATGKECGSILAKLK
ncbi:MAG TPA: tetratricopeptide repeat protein [Polyangiaceae bacterium]|nr:tetratricopeptide repeat protein [Polyangiaceae bacterium]